MIGARMPVAVALLASVGCVTVQPLRDPAQYISQANPKVVYVTYKNRSIMGVAEPRVSGDSLFGMMQGQSNKPVAVSLNQVERIEAFQRDGKRTTLLIAGLTVFVGGMTYLLIDAIGGEGASCSPFDERPEDC